MRKWGPIFVATIAVHGCVARADEAQLLKPKVDPGLNLDMKFPKELVDFFPKAFGKVDEAFSRLETWGEEMKAIGLSLKQALAQTEKSYFAGFWTCFVTLGALVTWVEYQRRKTGP